MGGRGRRPPASQSPASRANIAASPRTPSRYSRQLRAIPRKSVLLYDKYYLNVFDLVGSVVRLNSLRINRNKDDYQREVDLWVARHQVSLAAVRASEPKQQ